MLTLQSMAPMGSPRVVPLLLLKTTRWLLTCTHNYKKRSRLLRHSLLLQCPTEHRLPLLIFSIQTTNPRARLFSIHSRKTRHPIHHLVPRRLHLVSHLLLNALLCLPPHFPRFRMRRCLHRSLCFRRLFSHQTFRLRSCTHSCGCLLGPDNPQGRQHHRPRTPVRHRSMVRASHPNPLQPTTPLPRSRAYYRRRTGQHVGRHTNLCPMLHPSLKSIVCHLRIDPHGKGVRHLR